jgi:predicted transposase YbfD/YdcC
MPKPASPFVRCFSEVEDPRIDRNKKHLLTDIIVIVLCGVLSGVDDFEHIEEFASLREEWFRKFLPLPNSIASHDTMNRVFARIDTKQFEAAFVAWMEDVVRLTDGEIVAFDGKTIRGSFDRSAAKSPIHLVSAWASNNGVVLGQVRVEDKSNEITAIPRLLEMLDLKGCLVTIDAMGCQREIAQKIIDSDADYTLALKGNQKTLHRDVEAVFAAADLTALGNEAMRTKVDHGHGRQELRQYFLIDDVKALQKTRDWPGLKSIGLVRTIRMGSTTSVEDRYYINSYSGDVARFAAAARGHWGIESGLHWSLDVSFDEDASRVRKGHGAANLSFMRRAALNMLRRDPAKGSLRKKQLRCISSLDHLSKALFGRTI